MAETPDISRGTTEVLTRLAVAAERLGIDPAPLQSRLPDLGTAPGRYARVSVDTADRLAIRVPDGAPKLARPGDAMLELGTDAVEVAFAFARRPFTSDLPLLRDVSAETRDALAERVGSLGGGRCDALARRSDGVWLAGVAHELSDVRDSPVRELVAVTNLLLTITSALGVPAPQRDLLQKAHVVLAGGKGYTLWLACDHQHVLPQLTIEYRDVEWKHVVGLTDSLRPGTSSGPRLGILAGAFEAASAAAFAITYRSDDVADVCIAVESTSGDAS